MSLEIAIVFAMLLAALVLFSLERVPVDVVALGVLVVLLVARILTPAEALAGFSNEAVVVIGGLFVLTAGLRETGALDGLGRWVQRLGAANPRRAMLVLLVLVAGASAFINNTTCTAVFLPVAMTLAREAGLSPSRVLMPMAFASILGGTVTLIGTSTNVIVSGVLPSFGEPPFTMFELTPVGLPLAVAGLAYLALLGHRLLPAKEEGRLEEVYQIREYLCELVVEDDPAVAGRTVADLDLARRWGLNLVAIVRDGRSVVPRADERLHAGDLLLAEGTVETISKLEGLRGFTLRHRGQASDPSPLAQDPVKLLEVVVLPRSDLVGRTLKESRFRERYGAGAIALSRHGEALVDKIGRVRLRVGDVLLLHGEDRALRRLLAQQGLLVLTHRSPQSRPLGTAVASVAIFAAAVLAAATQLLPLPVAILLGCLLLFATRCLTPSEAYAAVDWRMLILIAGMVTYGKAFETTGAAELLAVGVVEAVGGLGPLAVLAGFYVLTVVLTQPMSNQAAALVVLPVALGVAAQMGINPRSMAVLVTLAASSSFLTPLEPSCLLVYGPGRYRFLDYPRLGAGITLMAFVLSLLLIPRVWPLAAGG